LDQILSANLLIASLVSTKLVWGIIHEKLFLYYSCIIPENLQKKLCTVGGGFYSHPDSSYFTLIISIYIQKILKVLKQNLALDLNLNLCCKYFDNYRLYDLFLLLFELSYCY